MNNELHQAKLDMLTVFRDFTLYSLDFEPTLTLDKLMRVMENTIVDCLFETDDDYQDVIVGIEASDDRRLVAALGVAYTVVTSAYAEAVETGMNYKDAYKLAKSRVEEYAAIVGKSPIYLLDHQ